MSLKLIKLTEEYKDALIEMIDEWTFDQKKNNTDTSPSSIFKNDPRDFSKYLSELEITNPKEGYVKDSTFFLLDDTNNRLIGAVNIRHELNNYLLNFGGHIGDGIRPSERRKGYATELIRLALEECKKIGIEKVLITCSSSNIGSKKSIIRNGGILENTIMHDGEVIERYWIYNK